MVVLHPSTVSHLNKTIHRRETWLGNLITSIIIHLLGSGTRAPSWSWPWPPAPDKGKQAQMRMLLDDLPVYSFRWKIVHSQSKGERSALESIDHFERSVPALFHFAQILSISGHPNMFQHFCLCLCRGIEASEILLKWKGWEGEGCGMWPRTVQVSHTYTQISNLSNYWG